MTSYEKHYIALGLRREASREEIRSAFRKIAKRYHPDQDSSLDAERKYREARLAYDALYKSKKTVISQPPSPPSSPSPQREAKRQSAPPPRGQASGTARGTGTPGFAGTRQTANGGNSSSPGFSSQWGDATCCGNGWYSYDCDCDDVSDYGFGERIPFTVCKIPIILLNSIVEAASVETFVRALLYIVMTNFTLNGLGYSAAFSNVVTFSSLIMFVFFRYYHPHDPGDPDRTKANLYAKFIWSLVYILAAGFFLILFSPVRSIFSIRSWLNVPVEVFLALFILWAPRIFQGRSRSPFV